MNGVRTITLTLYYDCATEWNVNFLLATTVVEQVGPTLTTFTQTHCLIASFYCMAILCAILLNKVNYTSRLLVCVCLCAFPFFLLSRAHS